MADRTSGTTKWRNDTQHKMDFSIFLSPGNFMRVQLNPGDTIDLPSMYDSAIQELDKSGRYVVAGLAPNMTRVGSNVPLHPSLVTEDTPSAPPEAPADKAEEKPAAEEKPKAAPKPKAPSPGTPTPTEK